MYPLPEKPASQFVIDEEIFLLACSSLSSSLPDFRTPALRLRR